MALNPKFLDLERIVIQCRGKQSELDVFEKCCSYEDYTTLFLGTNISLRITGDKLL